MICNVISPEATIPKCFDIEMLADTNCGSAFLFVQHPTSVSAQTASPASLTWQEGESQLEIRAAAIHLRGPCAGR